MKKTIGITAFMLATTAAHAKTVCNLNRESVKDSSTYDQILFTGELKPSAPRSVVLRPGSTTAEEKSPESLEKIEGWASINGATVAIFSFQEEGRVSIMIGQVDMRNGATNVLAFDRRSHGQSERRSVLEFARAQ
ncbi:MAG: hypothetical protein HC902_14535 [Calothrix sp. SM1_5_4]|nr:hypothetical protein [Calothrix sp. SM1_5_4]